MKKIIYYTSIFAVALLIIFAAYYTFRYVIPTRLTEGDFEKAIVNYGEVIRTIDAEGIVEPENEVLLRSASGGVIKKIVTVPGSHVRPGEIILMMDTEPVEKEIENAEDQLEVMKNDLRKNRLNARATRVDLDYNVEMKKLKIASIESDLSDEEQLLEVGGISPAKIAKTRQELVFAQKELETILEKNSIRLKQLEAEEEGLLLQIEIREKELERKREILGEMIIRAPSSGIVLNIFGKEGEKFNTGDLLVQMSNMNSFKITGSLDESFADVVKTGGKVFAQLDNKHMPGQIGRVKPVIENNRINFDVFLEENNNPNLIPNMKVKLEVVTAQRDSVLRIKKGPAIDGSGMQNIFIVKTNKAIREEAEIGLVGADYVEIINGAGAGDEMIISDVSSFRHMKEVEIEN